MLVLVMRFYCSYMYYHSFVIVNFRISTIFYPFMLSGLTIFICETVDGTFKICICAPLHVSLMNEEYIDCFSGRDWKSQKKMIPSVMMSLIWKDMLVIAERDSERRSCIYAIDRQRNRPIFWTGNIAVDFNHNFIVSTKICTVLN